MLVDSHCHPYMADFDADRPAVLARAREAGVSAMIAVGYDLPSSRQAIALAEAEAEVFACVALHPHHALEATPAALSQLRELAAHPRVVALGEIGLDYFRNLAPLAAQQAAFRAQLRLAAELALPVVIHDRDAHADLLALLAEAPDPLPGVILHCFSGDLAMAEEAWRRGYYTSLAGPLTYPSATGLRAVAEAAPRDKILIETDAPYLPPVPHRGRRNEPAHVRLVAEELAARWGTDLAEVAAVTTANARRAFRLGDGGTR